MNSRTLRRVGVAVIASGAVLVGCTDARQARLEGAQRALSALPDVEVVSSDAATGRLTVRSRSTGTMTTIDVQSGIVKAATTAAAPPTGDAGRGDAVDDSATAGGSTLNAGAPPSDASSVAGDIGKAGQTRAADAAATPLAPAAAANGRNEAPNATSTTVLRDPQGRVQKIQGSGFSIERSPGAPGATLPAVSARATAPAAAGGTAARRRVSLPFVCAAGENRTLQAVELDVPGAGIVAERGCTLTVANVRVRAGGWALVVNPGATVRIDDSLVEGRTGALDLYPGGSLSAWATTFRGALGRPVAKPQFIDRGGNAWD